LGEWLGVKTKPDKAGDVSFMQLYYQKAWAAYPTKLEARRGGWL
jgi:hypothetical protein